MPFERPRWVREAVDWSELRLPGEMDLRREIEKRPGLLAKLLLWSQADQVRGLFPAGFVEKGLLANAGLSPRLDELLRIASQTLRIEQHLPARVFSSMELVVEWVVDSADETELTGVSPLAASASRSACLVLSSGLLERMRTDEILFWIGQKWGHWLLGHWPLLADPSAGVKKPDHETLLARGVWKFQNLSADRVGLVCCQNVESASRAIVKRVCGLGSDWLEPNWESLSLVDGEEEEAMVGDDIQAFTLLRLRALRQFAESSTYARLFEAGMGRSSVSRRPSAARLRPESHEQTGFPKEGWIEPNELNEAMSADLHQSSAGPWVEDDLGSNGLEPGPNLHHVDAFVFHAAYWLAGTEELEERQWVALEAALESTEPAESFSKDRIEKRPAPSVDVARARCVELAPSMERLPDEERLLILDRLVPIAIRSGRIEERGQQILQEITRWIGFGEEDLAQVTAEYIDPEYADYEFQVGQEVEVYLDGEWLAGVVEEVDIAGDLRVMFGDGEGVLRLNRTADWIRPAMPHSRTS